MTGASVYRAGNVDYYLIRKKPKKGKPVFHVRILAPEVDPTGRRKVLTQKSTGQTNEQAAHSQVQQWIETGRFQNSPDSVQRYIGDFWTRESAYVRELDEGAPVSELHLENRYRQAAAFVEWCAPRGIVMLSDITRSILSEYRDWITREKQSNSTRSDYWRAVTIPIERAVIDGKLYVSPVPPLKRSTASRGKHKAQNTRQAFDVPELVDLFQFARWDDLRARTGALLALTCSLRRAEVRGLTWACVRPRSNTLDVLYSWRDKEKLSPPKWFHERHGVPVPPAVMVELKALAPESGGGFIFADMDDPTVPVKDMYFLRAMRRAGKAGETAIPIIGQRRDFHSLRHSYVSVSDARIVDERRRALRAVAGHRDDNTQAHYRHVLQSEEQRIAMEWNEWLQDNRLTVDNCPENHPSMDVFNQEVIRRETPSLRLISGTG